MENAPVISMGFSSGAPGADAEVIRRSIEWVREAYLPMLVKASGATGVDQYQIIRESPQYPSYGVITHYENLNAYQDSLQSPERSAISEDLANWAKRGVREGIWYPTYELEKGFRSEPGLQGDRLDTRIENAPIMHLEAYRLSPKDQEKYSKWLEGYGYNVFIPLFVKLSGLKGYDCYKFTGLTRREARESEYPPYLSIVYFENLKTYEDYAKSPELVTFKKAIRAVFPLGLELKWYIQYQLIRSLRK